MLPTAARPPALPVQRARIKMRLVRHRARQSPLAHALAEPVLRHQVPARRVAFPLLEPRLARNARPALTKAVSLRCELGHWFITNDNLPELVESGQTSCTPASIGSYVPTAGATSQTACPAGKTTTTTGATSCTSCPAGSSCSSGTTTKCAAGTFSTSGGSSCTSCPAGTFNSIAGATACCQCPSGWYSDSAGATSCTKCGAKGMFSQGYTDPGATSSGSCSARSGAVSTATQGSTGTCPAVTAPVTTTATTSTSAVPAPSQHARRSDTRYCPVGWKACSSKGATWTRDAMECVNVRSDLESCGGCVLNDSPNGTKNASGGRDCSAIPNVAAVRCSYGDCIIEHCQQGYALDAQGETCLKTSSASPSKPIKPKHYAKQYRH
ncbi:hypothetical protein DL93DRAFT_1726542 [Clavulina sp. PMI_390]|nr:hypothetical protein DL93DRAFT_1726542 [Clavulina sp. PMI_390]